MDLWLSPDSAGYVAYSEQLSFILWWGPQGQKELNGPIIICWNQIKGQSVMGQVLKGIAINE
jgi:hypothetical protein